MMQLEAWRWIGLASTIVGLLCYALSSSFNHLFGRWNLLKLCLYSIFSLIICFLVLFAKIWQGSPGHRFKAHTTFFVLTITSVYSFFSDKVVNGKPDAYSLISCAAFSIMSLSLSWLSHCSFQVDLLYFFLGCLIVQLMKINLSLAIVGLGFSYILVVVRSSFDSHEFNFENANPNMHVVIEVDSDIVSMSQRFATCMKELQQGNLNIIDVLLEQLKEYLVDDSELVVKDSELVINMLPLETINELREAAGLMVGVGSEKECSDVYSNFRKEFLEESLSRLGLGLQKLSNEDVPWNNLRDEIQRWIKAANITFKILLPIERRLCDRVFFGFSSTADSSFLEISRGSTTQLLDFADAIATGSRSPEKLFRILDMFETLGDLIPEFESLFSDQYSVSLRNKAITISKRLGEAINGIFVELENLICREPTKAADYGVVLRPITRYVMNYLRAACRYRQTLEQVFEDYGHHLREYPEPKVDDRVPSSSYLSVQIDRIVELLESNFEAKSKIYKEPALCYVFLMNNAKYIVQKIKESELETILGNDWIQKHTDKFQQYRIQYQKTTSWDQALEILKLDSNGSIPSNGTAKSMKKKLKSFYTLFEEICRNQCSWFMFDEELREEIRISLEKILLPAYESFIARFQSVPELGKHADKYIKYGTEDIEARLKDLFQGRNVLSSSRK